MSDINQRAFDTMARHLRAQNARSVENVGCRYRTTDGRRCAVGALIDDANYTLDLEGKPICDVVYDAVVRSGYDGVDFDLLASVQDIHDCVSVTNWPEALRNVARHHGLDPSVLD